MAIFIIYIIRWAVVFTLLYSLFRLFMKRETLHGVNRMVLLFVLAASMILPLCQIETPRANIVTKSREMIEHHIQNDQNPLGDDVKNVTIINPDNEMSYTPVPIHEDTNVYILLAVAVYLLGLILFWLHYFWQLGSLLLLINRGKCIEIEGLPKQIRVLTNPEVKNPCCWMRWIILNPKDANSRLILQHEMAHLHLGHSWDMLLCELTCRMLWFLPFSWMLRQELRDIHEYQADRRVLDRADTELAEEYQQLLIRRATSEEGRSEIYTTPHVESSLHQSPIKRRFKMMYQRPSTRWAMLKAAYLLPLCIFALVAFARPQAMNEIETEVKKAESDFVASMQSPSEVGNDDSDGSSVQNYSYSNDERNIEEEVTNAISKCYDVVFDWYNKQRDTLHVEHHFDEVYLTKEFYDLQEEARRISWEIDDIGPFDCDHWIQAQDWSVMGYSIDSVNVLSNDSADVYMMIRNGNERTPVLLKVAYATNHRIPSSKQWLVDDFISKGWEGKQYSEKQILHDYIEEYPQDSIMVIHR